MYKIFLTIILATALSAKLVSGVAVVVKGTPITIQDIETEMKVLNKGTKFATDYLIRKALEEQEIKERKISVTSGDVYDEIKKTAARNNLTVSEFYEAVREANGLTSQELKEKIKERLLSQKLYSAIAYRAISEPDQSEIEEYFNSHKELFSHPGGFKVIIYQSKDKSRLQEKINNPMLYSPDISKSEQTLPYSRISPELAKLLQDTSLNSFTAAVPDGKNGYISFYLKEVEPPVKAVNIDDVKYQIINAIISEQREQVLSDYFDKLRYNAEIVEIRKP